MSAEACQYRLHAILDARVSGQGNRGNSFLSTFFLFTNTPDQLVTVHFRQSYIAYQQVEPPLLENLKGFVRCVYASHVRSVLHQLCRDYV